jgi:tight adherence protein B
LEEWFFQRRLQKTERQLADSIDMMVAAVKAGAGLQSAMQSTLENTPSPWRQELEEVVGRIRYGDDPVEVLTDLSDRVPLETVRLFAQTLAVNWTVGGRLSQTLANVARTIRDRLELTRRMHAMTTQARLSVVSIIAVTYFIAALMWRNDPERMGGFLSSLVGQGLVATAMILQAVGIVWISRLSTPRF